jgi:hypothetical protein
VMRKSHKSPTCLPFPSATATATATATAKMTTLLLTETTLFFHDVVSRTEKPCGLARVTKWTIALAKEHIIIDCATKAAKKRTADAAKHAADEAKEDTDKGKTHDHALTFGPGSKDLSSITLSLLHATTPASVFSSTPTTNVGSSEGNPAIVQAFGGFQDENNNLEELVSVLGKQGSHSVCGSTPITIIHFIVIFLLF